MIINLIIIAVGVVTLWTVCDYLYGRFHLFPDEIEIEMNSRKRNKDEQ